MGHTALICACRSGHPEAAKAMVQAGADKEKQNNVMCFHITRHCFK
jgi:ankyrin repeat protein